MLFIFIHLRVHQINVHIRSDSNIRVSENFKTQRTSSLALIQGQSSHQAVVLLADQNANSLLGRDPWHIHAHVLGLEKGAQLAKVRLHLQGTRFHPSVTQNRAINDKVTLLQAARSMAAISHQSCYLFHLESPG